jgi:hypothetical protein
VHTGVAKRVEFRGVSKKSALWRWIVGASGAEGGGGEGQRGPEGRVIRGNSRSPIV